MRQIQIKIFFQIRGVASKQLVNDAVVSVSGRPLSYEQVLCRLPKLEIHEIDSEDYSTNFDLKDNTDHTQLLVKVSLEYHQNGGRSAPLDLLLYDSLCWECTTDGCRANTKENKCFFASGTSALQIFRIGRTIATRVSPGKRIIEFCNLTGKKIVQNFCRTLFSYIGNFTEINMFYF